MAGEHYQAQPWDMGGIEGWCEFREIEMPINELRGADCPERVLEFVGVGKGAF